MVHDLGAESIDLLDIGFRVYQTFGVELPTKAIQVSVLSWRNMGELTGGPTPRKLTPRAALILYGIDNFLNIV